jgi:mono/diheme cytochrome c family protein
MLGFITSPANVDLPYRLLRLVRSGALFIVAAALAIPSLSLAQSATNGRTLYTTPQVTGQLSCSNGGCHGPDPTTNQNRIRNGANNPTAIANAINGGVSVMAFLRGRLTSAQLSDLATYIANPGSTNTSPIATVSPATLGFGSVNVGSSSGVQAVSVSNTGAGNLQLSAITLSTGEFVRSGGTCAAGTSLAAAASCSIGVIFSPSATGVRSATLSIAHNAAGSVSTVSLAGTGAAATGATTTMVEYYFAALDYYFITSRAGDIALLDTLAAWRRTGQSFKVYTAQQSGTAGINRYYFDQVAVNNSRGSHFYTLVQSEKDALASLNQTNAQTPRLPYNEGTDSFAFPPLVEGVGGSCAAGQVPVFRIFRGQTRFPDNPNHRFTTDTAIYNSFVALGWDGEGVKFCAPN